MGVVARAGRPGGRPEVRRRGGGGRRPRRSSTTRSTSTARSCSAPCRACPGPARRRRAPARRVAPGEPTLAFDGVTVTYPGRLGSRPFTAGHRRDPRPSRRGEVVGLVGESGSGKTTLGRVAAGLVPVSRRSGAGRRARTCHRVRPRAARAAPRPRLRPPGPGVLARPAPHRRRHRPRAARRAPGRRRTAERRARVRRAARRRPPRVVVRRPAAARALRRPAAAGRAGPRPGAASPTLVVADEPTSALDVSVQADVLELFRDASRSELGFACLFISHDLAVVHEVAAPGRRAARAGELVEVGDADEVLRRPEHPYTRRLVDAVPVPDPARRPGRGPRRAGVVSCCCRRWGRAGAGAGGHGPSRRPVPAGARAPRGQAASRCASRAGCSRWATPSTRATSPTGRHRSTRSGCRRTSSTRPR